VTAPMLRLTVLGSCGTYPGPGRACSGYLLEGPPARPGERPTRVWIDTGSGTLANLLRYASLEEIDAVWLSHLHIDHCTDLPVAYFTLKYGPTRRATPLTVFGPTGWQAHIERFMTVDTSKDITDMLAVHELRDGEELEVGGLGLTAVATHHSVETYAVRADAGETSLAYSADAGPTGALARVAAGTGLFLCEAAWPELPEGAEPIHCTPGEAGEWAATAGAGRLVLTHLRPHADQLDAAAKAEAAYGGAVGIAIEGNVYEVGGT
jgi:ribonuclease BN (tRNA processing enzyme)